MTERFKHTRNAIGMQFISYDEKEILIGTFADAKGVTNIVELLNTFNEENEQLKEESEVCKQAYDEIKSDAINLKKENEELKSIKRFAERNGINVFLIDEAFQKCWNDNGKLIKENEQLKEQLSEAKTDEKQLGISFMGYKMKLIEVLQKKYDKVKGKTLYADVYTEIAEEMGVDLE